MKFQRTTAINKLLALHKRIKVIPGGTSAGKTFGILPVLIDKAARTAGLEISVVSESIPHLRKGALKDFLNILKTTHRYVDEHYNRTLLTYTFANGSYVEFFSADEESKVRGPRRHILYINECNNLNFETYHQLAIRTSMDIYLDFNPTARFWVHEELENDPDAQWLRLTYKDNEALPPSIVGEIEKARAKGFFNPEGDINDPANIKNSFWANWWRVYGLGVEGVVQELVFSNWSIIEQLPPQARYQMSGIDYGFTNDPTTCIDKYYADGHRIYDEVLYEKGLINSEIARRLKTDQLKRLIVADSAEPKSNRELQLYGLNVKSAVKGRDSINFGIQLLQQEHFYVTRRSLNLIAELRRYCWLKDSAGTITNTPADAYNHCIDPMRYMETYTRLNPVSKRKSSKVL